MKNLTILKWFYKKPLFIIGLPIFIVVFYFSFKIYFKNNRELLSKEKNLFSTHQSGPGKAAHQNFLMTQDPKLGYPPSERMKIVRSKIGMNASSMIPGGPCITWDERGPGNIGGRTRALMYDPNDATHNKVWAGGVAGGLWYTDDIHQTNPVWIQVNDFWDNIAITCIAHHPTATNNFYVGTGEGYFQDGVGDGVRGAGIWYSSNGGVSWVQLPSTDNADFYFVQKIAIEQNGNIYAATRSGLQLSTDNGQTWTMVLGNGINVLDALNGVPTTVTNNNAADVEIGADGTIYAAIGLVGNWEGGFRLLPGTTQWQRMTDSNSGCGFPAPPDFGRIELAVAPSNAQVIYALVTAHLAGPVTPFPTLGLWRSQDRGENWIAIPFVVNNQSWYDMTISVDPLDADIVYENSTNNIYRKVGGGQFQVKSSWVPGSSNYVHTDQQIFVHEPGPNVQERLLVGSDGGISYSDNINIWFTTPDFYTKNGLAGDGYRTTQFYSCAMAPFSGSDYFMGGTQDNDVQIFNSPGIANTSSWGIFADGGYCFIDIDPALGSAYIGSTQFNNYFLSPSGLPGTFNTILTGPGSTSGRFVNPADYDYKNHILYTGHFFNDIEYVDNILGVPNPPVQINIPNMQNIASAIRVSPFISGNVYVGTGPTVWNNYGGQLFRIENPTTAPIITELTAPQTGQGYYISCIEFGASENDILLTYSNYGVSSVFESHDGGTTWLNKDQTDLPDMPIRWALYNPLDRREVLLATESGVWMTHDITLAMPHWFEATSPISRTRVDMLRYRDSDKMILAATHGRGLFSTCYFNHPIADFSYSIPGNCTDLNVNFTDNSTNGAISWTWDFGDGNTSSQQNPTHTYSQYGIYTVKLTVINDCGCNYIYKQVGVGPWVKQVSTDLLGEHGGDVCVDASGNIFITCSYTGKYNLDGVSFGNPGLTNIYVAMLNSQGEMQWVAPLNTSGLNIINPKPNALYLDAANNALYVTASGKYDIYLARIDMQNGALLWEKHYKQLTNHGNQKGVTGGYDVCTDLSGHIYLTGAFGGGIMFNGSTIVYPSNLQGPDYFVAKFAPNGAFLWVKHDLGAGRGIVFNTLNNNEVIITGTNDAGNVLFNCYNTSSSALVWSKPQGTGTVSFGNGIDMDINGKIYLTGYFTNTATFGVANVISNGGRDIFFARYDNLGNYVGVNSYGAQKDDEGKAIYSEDGTNSTYLTGTFSGIVNFPPASLSSIGAHDIFTCKIENNTAVMPWVVKYGGDYDDDAGNGIFSDFNSGVIYEIGNYTDYSSFGTLQLYTSALYNSAYLKKICAQSPTLKISANSNEHKLSLVVNPTITRDWIYVEVSELKSEIVKLLIYDLQGNLLMNSSFNCKKSKFYHQMELSELSAGTYLIKVQNGNESISKRFIRL